MQANEQKAAQEIRDAYPCGTFLYEVICEYMEKKTAEAQLAHDADQIELLLVLKKQHELGNPRALVWYDKTRQRLKSPLAQQIADTILTTPSDAWWMVKPDDPHWIHG